MNLHVYADGRDRLMDDIIAGLEMTPDSPTFTEARDGILAAALASSPEDYNVVATAFAKRGMGVDAVSPDRSSTTNSGVVESYQAASPYTYRGYSLEMSYQDGTQGSCDDDNDLDAGEYGYMTLTVGSAGAAPMSSSFTAKVKGSSGLSFPDGNKVEFVPSADGLSATGIIPVSTDASFTGHSATAKVTFPLADIDEVVGVTPATATSRCRSITTRRRSRVPMTWRMSLPPRPAGALRVAATSPGRLRIWMPRSEPDTSGMRRMPARTATAT